MKVFITEDNTMYASMIENHLMQHHDIIIEKYTTGEACIEAICRNPDLILLDFHLNIEDESAKTGHDFLKEIKAIKPEQAIVMLSSMDSVPQVVNLLQIGAYDYVLKDENAFSNLDKIIFNLRQVMKMKLEMIVLKSQLNRHRKRMAYTAAAVAFTVITVWSFL